MTTRDVQRKKRKLVPEMEGTTARWYARNRGSASQLEAYRRQAAELTRGLPDGAEILEVAPGPGYQAVELAKAGSFRVTGLDVARTFVEIADEHARAAGVQVDFRHGDVHRMPFEDGSFDLVVCQAAFKNFTEPVRALDEMHRVLRTGGTVIIDDLNREASGADVAAEVGRMGLSGANAFATRRVLAWLRRRAFSRAEFARLAAASAFGGCEVHADRIRVTVRLTRH